MTISSANLSGIPETMLWTLHNRASEVLRPGAWLDDQEALRIYHSINYDYQRSFGKPDSCHAVRSLMFDDALGPWLEKHPDGTVVELACGLETQFQRRDNGRVNWLCVDVPEAIAIRERFLQPGERCRHLSLSALDSRWMEAVEKVVQDSGVGSVFITAQGLFMYFEEAQVRQLVSAILERFPGAELMFDTIPRWFSRKTVSPRGLWKTPHYRTPPMPWGIDRNEIVPTLRAWSDRLAHAEEQPYRRIRGPWGLLASVVANTPGLKNKLPAIVRLRAWD